MKVSLKKLNPFKGLPLKFSILISVFFIVGVMLIIAGVAYWFANSEIVDPRVFYV